MERQMESAIDSYHDVASAFQCAVQKRPDLVCESYYCFGGQSVRMRVVGRALAHHLTRAFAHLEIAALGSQVPQLTIDLWDESESGIPHPTNSLDGASDLTWKTSGGLLTAYAGGRLLSFQQSAGATWFERRSRHIIGWRHSGEQLEMVERSKPLPFLLSIWYYDHSVYILHAGLISQDGQGVLIGGPSGTGKSTTSLVCLLAGFDFLGDDHIGLSVGADGAFVGYSLYNGARLSPDVLSQLPTFQPYAVPSDSLKDDKFLVLLSEVLPAQVERAVTLCAIVLPRISHLAKSRLQPASKREAMLRLAPTSFFTPFSSGARGFQRLGQLVDQVPRYWLDMTEHPDEIPPLIQQVLTDASKR